MELVRFPKAAENVTEGTVSRWLVTPGARVQREQPLVELITEKAEFELPSPVAGRISAIFAPERATVPVGYVLCVISEEGEPIPDIEGMNADIVMRHQAGLMGAAERAPNPVGGQESPAGTPSSPPDSAGQSAPSNRTTASPAARRLARDKGIELADVASRLGISRQLTEDDVRRFLSGG